jgi:hypothetical protein
MPGLFSRIFLLSHMRARTSLAGHILGSHPQINGYFELHISYEDASSLDKQLAILLEHETLKENSRYLFDKLLHNDYRLDTGLLDPADDKILVSLLEPEHTIKSIVALFQKKDTGDLYALPAGAANYYFERVKWLADFCRSAGQPYYYYDAALFRAAPSLLLGRLTDWLALDSPLSERYQLFSQTGISGKGDSSEFIRSGKIGTSRGDYSHIRIPKDVLEKARAVYRDCRAMIIANAADSALMPGDTELD